MPTMHHIYSSASCSAPVPHRVRLPCLVPVSCRKRMSTNEGTRYEQECNLVFASLTTLAKSHGQTKHRNSGRDMMNDWSNAGCRVPAARNHDPLDARTKRDPWHAIKSCSHACFDTRPAWICNLVDLTNCAFPIDGSNGLTRVSESLR